MRLQIEGVTLCWISACESADLVNTCRFLTSGLGQNEPSNLKLVFLICLANKDMFLTEY